MYYKRRLCFIIMFDQYVFLLKGIDGIRNLAQAYTHMIAMESIKTWLFGKQESAVQEAMPSLSTAQENMLQGEEKDNMCKNQSKGTPTNLDNSLSSSIDSHINLTGTIETVPELQENVNLAKDAENHKVFRTSVYKHTAYATRKLGITHRHLKALKTLFVGVWSHYMLLEYYLPSIVKYGPDVPNKN
ncbi:hypothetical protein MAR_000022, partial [Mya arenaria]